MLIHEVGSGNTLFIAPTVELLSASLPRSVYRPDHVASYKRGSAKSTYEGHPEKLN